MTCEEDTFYNSVKRHSIEHSNVSIFFLLVFVAAWMVPIIFAYQKKKKKTLIKAYLWTFWLWKCFFSSYLYSLLRQFMALHLQDLSCQQEDGHKLILFNISSSSSKCSGSQSYQSSDSWEFESLQHTIPSKQWPCYAASNGYNMH